MTFRIFSKSEHPRLLRFGKSLAIVAICTSLIFAGLANAAKPVYSGGKERAAVRGYDVVAYFNAKKPVKGLSEFSTRHAGAKWLFASNSNLVLFTANPEKYMPQYGGYCAYAVAKNSTASSKPQYFTVHEGKLYMNYSKSVYNKWLKDKSKYIEHADKNWPELVD